MANPSLAFGALAKPSRFNRDVKKHATRGERAKAKRADDMRERVEWACLSAGIFNRDQGRCRVCGRAVKLGGKNPKTRAETHHIVYRSAGGSDDSTNLLTACGECHFLEHQHRIEITGNGDGVVSIVAHDEAGNLTFTHSSPCPTVDARPR